MDEFHIRQAEPGDLDALCQLEAATFSYDQIGRRSFRYLLQSKSSLVLVCYQGAQSARSTMPPALLGYAIVLTRKNSRYWRLYSMATSAEARGRGLGKAMLQEIIHRAKQSAGGMRLEVKCDNAIGIGLYRQLGFEVTDLLPEYYSDNSDGYRMQVSW
ncbi:MAG: GNAT family N-acetyltransferase [Idiomarina sp.]|nr:GNAT family N-acetyltransferase [Idiomarina sp.]